MFILLLIDLQVVLSDLSKLRIFLNQLKKRSENSTKSLKKYYTEEFRTEKFHDVYNLKYLFRCLDSKEK